MAEGPIINVLCEGDEDRALAAAVIRDAAFAGVLKVEKLPDADRRRLPDGMEGLADRAALYVPTARGELGGRVVVLRDLDGDALPAVHAWFEMRLRAAVGPGDAESVVTREPTGDDERVSLFRVRRRGIEGRVALVGVGLPEARERHFGVVQYTSDDYVLRALLDPVVYRAAQLAERDNEFRRIDGAVALHKLRRVIEVLRDAADGGAIPVEQSKRVTQIFRGLTDFRASNATFTERVLKAVSSHPVEEDGAALWRPLRDDLLAAVRKLRAPSATPN